MSSTIDLSAAVIAVRFAEERGRLGLTHADLAASGGVTRQYIGKIERGVSVPGGEVLAGLSSLGGDVEFVLTGRRRVGRVDATVFGMCEVALVHAYQRARPDAPTATALRSGPIVQVYNQVIDSKRAQEDLAAAVRDAADLMVASLSDPLDPELLERNLLRPATREVAAQTAVTVQGSGQRIAGRDYHEGGKKR